MFGGVGSLPEVGVLLYGDKDRCVLRIPGVDSVSYRCAIVAVGGRVRDWIQAAVVLIV